MQSSAWISLFRLIPHSHHENLSLTTQNGTEITLQSIIRMEMDYVVLRGRLQGSSDAGRVFFVPYDQINFVAFLKEVKEPVIRAFFGEVQPAPASAAPARVDADTVADSEPEPLPEAMPLAFPATPTPPDSPTPPEPVHTGLRPAVSGKSAILERLRNKAAASSTPKPPSN